MVFITSQSISAEIVRQQLMARDIAIEQGKISTGHKLNQPSDNPQDWVQISLVGRQQSLNTAWKDNLTFAQSRADKASTNLKDINGLMSRVTDLLVTSTSTSNGSPGREAVAQELDGIRETIKGLLNQTDFQGQPVFDDGTSNLVPIGTGLAVDAVGTRQSISDNAVGTRTLDQVLADAIAAVRTGTDADRSTALTDSRKALDHVIVAQSLQGVRTQRLDDISERLVDNALALTERRSTLEDTDLTETITKLQQKLTTLEAAQMAFARINKQTLFDLI
jgi:flagellar hook-associated protein 3 FlgL